MRLIFRLLVILVVCLTAIALPVAPTQAQCTGAFIELFPISGVPGTEVTIYGYDFAKGVLVDIYYDGDFIDTDRTDSRGDFTFFLTIPEGGKGHYRVLARGKYASVDAYFAVRPGLTVSPEEGPAGTTVTVQGRGFVEKEEGIELMYYSNGGHETIERNIVANAKGSWERSFQIPPSTRGEHKLDAEGAESRLYEVQDAIFEVTGQISLDKPSGIVDESIAMTGIQFAANERGIKILFAGQAIVTGIKANPEGEWEASFEVPEMPTGEYDVTAEGEQTRKEDIDQLSFEIKPGVVLSPEEGHVDMDLTVTGGGFAADEDVVIMYDDSQVATATTNDKGSLSGVSFSVPESQHGEHWVTAACSTDNAASAIFTMESDPPPVPTLLSPANRSRMGFWGEVAPTFEWSEVSDDSGVHYRLQIATSADVTTTGFVDPLVSEEGLVGTSYTLEETEALPLGAYYWIVQAVDGAENESGWTETSSFRVGLLPLWGFVAAIAAAVVLLIVLIRALVIRRSIYFDRW